MTKKRSINIVFAFAIFISLQSCQDKDNEVAMTPTLPGIKNIVGYQTIMPHTEGYELFEVNCITCHSLRYIQTQPDFSKQKWETIVDKMVKNFGASIPDSTAKIIVAYLTEVKGEE